MKRHLPTSIEELRGLRARGLVRVSTERQADGAGPDTQREREVAFAERSGLAFDGTWYEDHKSGSKAAARPDFQRMVRDAEAGRFDVLMVYDTSRFGRNRREVAMYEQRLHEAGVVVAYALNGVVSNDPTQQMLLAVNQTSDGEWLRVHRERLFMAYAKRFAAAKWSGTAPLGYRMGYESTWDAARQVSVPVETGRLVPDTVERTRDDGATYTNAELVATIGELYATGRMGARPMAAHLNAEGYRTVSGGLFSGGSIRHILENPAYNGWTTRHQRQDKRRHGEAPSEPVLTHEPLWDDRLWRAIQKARKRAHRGGVNGGRKVNTYPFRRLVLCDRCGRRMYGESHAHKGEVPTLGYGCIVAREQKACDQRFIQNATIEAIVTEALTAVSGHEVADWGSIAEALTIEADAQGLRPQRQLDVARIERQLAAAKDLRLMGELSHEEYLSRTRALRAQLDADIPEGTITAEGLARAAERFDDLARLWVAATPGERASIAQALFEEVRVRDGRVVSVRLADPTFAHRFAAYSAAADEVPPDGLEPPTQALGRPRSVH